MPIQIAIVEDDLRFLEELRFLLDGSPFIQIIGTYTTGKEAIKGIIEKCPDVALIDLGLPDISGIEVIKAIFKKHCNTELVVLTVYDDDEHLFSALKAGATGYIVKDEISLSEITRVVKEVINGGAPMSRGIAKRVLNEFRNIYKDTQPKFQNLTNRETEILNYLAKGYTPKKLAEILNISYETVRSHLKNIYRKLRANSMIEALAKFGH